MVVAGGFNGYSTPIFLICRDKVSQLHSLLSWLERAGYRRIVLVDNASTYEPMVEFLQNTSHEVIRHRENLGPYKSVWGSGVTDRLAPGQYYVVSDSDVVPDFGCPSDLVDFLHCVLQRYPGYAKAGPALRIDDLPDHYDLSAEVRSWERQWWWRPLEPGLYHAPIDTTFALYRPNAGFALAPAIRTARPYWAQHLPWYVDSRVADPELQHYRAHASPRLIHWDQSGRHQRPPIARMPLRERLMWPIHARFRVLRERSISCQERFDP